MDGCEETDNLPPGWGHCYHPVLVLDWIYAQPLAHSVVCLRRKASCRRFQRDLN